MNRALSVALAAVALTGCIPIENELVPLWTPSPLQRLGCDGVADARAGAEERPVAVCEAAETEVAPLYGVVAVDGSNSYDPNGNEIVDYSWRVVSAPEGAGRIPVDPTPRESFTPLVAGEYTLELVVTNDQCVTSDPCRVTVLARPEQDLWIELTWAIPGDDMDLHLLRPGATRESEGDCYFGNCVTFGPDWGRPGVVDDDPILDLDDIEGTGPENINIAEPEPVRYVVAVHDYPGSVVQRDNEVTVRVYLDGILALERREVFRGEDAFRELAVVDVAAGEVRPL